MAAAVSRVCMCVRAGPTMASGSLAGELGGSGVPETFTGSTEGKADPAVCPVCLDGRVWRLRALQGTPLPGSGTRAARVVSVPM